MAEIAREVTSAAQDEKTTRALRLVSAWCRLHEKTKGDIPAMFERTTTRMDVGILAFAIRTRAELDLIQTGDLLGVHSGSLLALQQKMIQRIRVNQIPAAVEQLQQLLQEAGFVTVAVKPSEAKARRFSPDARRALQAARQRSKEEGEKRLETEGDVVIDFVCKELGDLSRDDVMGSGLEPEMVDARYIIFAVLYYEINDAFSQEMVARYCKKTGNTISVALAKVSRVLRDPAPSLLKEKILRICALRKIDPQRMISMK